MKRLLFIVEQGGVPVYDAAWAQEGFDVEVVRTMRKALAHLRDASVDIVCAELNYDPNFRDRVSNLEPLLAKLQSTSPETRVIVFLEHEHQANLERLRERFQIFDALFYPLSRDDILTSLRRAATA